MIELAPLPASAGPGPNPPGKADPVPQTVAAVFAVPGPVDRSFSVALIDFLRPREMLLVLDNCEHVLAACAELATALLRACPDVYILATSREPLNIDGEIRWETPSLSLVDPVPGVDAGLLFTSEAAQLFLDRAAATQPGFAAAGANAPVVAQICRQLDGLPLAIELAAARVPALSVEQIAARLGDRFDLLKVGRRTAPERHQTLRAMIDWSYGLFSAQEKKLFRRLAVFAGGWTLEAAEEICADVGTALKEYGEIVPVLDALARMVSRSMVIAGRSGSATRYRFLETIRQYAQEKLVHSDEMEAMRDRHLEYILRWTAGANSRLIGSEQLAWLERFEHEHENIRAALEWALAGESRSEQALQLAVSSARFLRLRGYLSEGRQYLSRALNPARPGKRSAVRAQGLTWLANLAYLQSDFPGMHPLLEESLSIWQELGLIRSPGRANTLEMFGELMTEEGDYSRADELFQEALDIFREAKSEFGSGEVLMQFGWAAIRTGEYDQAEVWLNEFLALSRKTGYANHISFALSGLGELAVRQGQYEHAQRFLEESLALRRAHGDLWGTGTSLGSLGWAALRQGDYARMRAVLKESIAVRLDIGDRSGIAWCLEKLAEGALFESRARSSRDGLARAARILGAAAAIRAPLGSVIDPADEPEHERNRAALREALGEADFQTAWAAGEALAAQGLEMAVAEGLAVPGGAPLELHAGEGKPGGLSRREREVARLIVAGKSNRDIAVELSVELKTVEAHISHIFNKLGFNSRVQIAVWAVEKGLTDSRT